MSSNEKKKGKYFKNEIQQDIIEQEDTIQQKDIIEQEDKKTIKNQQMIIYLSYLIIILFWLSMNSYIYSSTIAPLSLNLMVFIILLLIPVVFIILNLINQLKILGSTHSDEAIVKLKEKLSLEKQYAKTVPVLVFGLGLITGSSSLKMKLSSFPFLLLSLLFGCVIPFVLISIQNSVDLLISSNQEVEDKSSNTLLLTIIESIEFSVESFSFSLILMAVFFPLIYTFNLLNKVEILNSQSSFQI